MNRLGIHTGGHDSTIAIETDGVYKVLELERYYGIRHFDLHRSEHSREEVAGLIRELYGLYEFESASLIGTAWYDSSVSTAPEATPDGIPDGEVARWAGLLQVKDQWNVVPHHVAHAASAFYQSPFDEALVISYDGGGNDGFFRPFLADRKSGARYLGPDLNLNLGSGYSTLAFPIREIHKAHESIQGASIRNAGRLMGLGAYGKVRAEWIEPVRDFYMQFPREFPRARSKRLPELGRRIGLNLEGIRDCIEGPEAFDFAATAEYVFSEIFFATVEPLLRRYEDLPVCLTGGCALNVLVNEELAGTVGATKLYVPPNPNDCGLALGALWQHHPPKERPVVTYSGVPLLDYTSGIPVFANPGYRGIADPWQVAKLLAEGAVIGVARGGSEHGPRALGNRSILADPGIPGLKDRLNTKIKFREVYRPYAPVVRKEDVSEYFNSQDYDMSFMSFCPTVREGWQATLQAITHEDGTARVQTVTLDQNPWLYAVLTEFKKIKGYGVLLNTSFNTRGKPILSTVAEAFDNLHSTDLDNLVIEDFLFGKVGETK